ncbi:MAG: site-specific DNA-methyltransferase [Candidatus Gastranaerophilales bacterium]|nr:site-specific DNA-methyltransferase [Candidatus Gastranaerophilales bacterium]
MERLAMETKNITDENIKKILELFPNVATEAKDENGKLKIAIDFEKLKQELSEVVIDGEESYDFTWVGKKKAMVEANRPIRKTLRPDRESSVDWENTQNIYIEGDNLDALKLLQESYLGKVKMIYIDPPYNTGSDAFTYHDDFSITEDEYKETISYEDEDGYKMFTNLETNPRFHSAWCSMMYMRLKLSLNLLRDDGIMFVSIDDHEVENLRKISSEIFGKKNELGVIARKTKLTSNKGTFLAPSHEYILIYSKNSECTQGFNDSEAQESDSYLKLFKYEDEYSKYNIVGLYQPSLDPMRGCSNQRYYIQCPDGSFVIPKGNIFPDKISDGSHIAPQSAEDKVWRWSYESYLNQKDNLVFIKTSTSPLVNEKNEKANWNVYSKIYLKDRLASGMLPVSFLDKYPNSEASKELIKLDIPFSFSKPKNLIKYLMKIMGVSKNDIVLDFFSGSATTAHSCIQLNAEDGGKRKFIMVQLPEKTDEKSDAYKAGYKNICKIGEERIRRAGKKIQEENPDKKLDIGFRVFKVDDTNMNDVYYVPKDYNKSMLEQLTSNIKDDRNDEDLLYGCLLDWGVELSLPHKVEIIDGKRVHIVAEDALIACFEDNIPESVIRKIAEMKPMRVVFRDSSFSSDDNKINVEEIFKLITPDTRVKVI